ncbi:cohesin domain-containing protein [Paenibacillus sp.]|uniref:cohesin domain-containing protein n=1 Tax=Paenibacillus sp. TaxID=58172 RepID=UPI002810F367|nr:cohesin domain-containing protein [Paenibacillus sp.]
MSAWTKTVKGAAALALLAAAILPAPQNPAAEANPAPPAAEQKQALPVFDQHLLLSALQEPYLKYKFMTPPTEPNYPFDGGYVETYDANAALLYLLFYAYYYPNETILEYNVTDEVRKRIEFLVKPGARNEPPSAGGITANWHYAAAYQTIVLAKHMPEVWDAIPDDAKRRIELMMKAQLISSNFIMNPANDAKTHATGQAGGIYSNPNHWESYNAVYQLALLYHGSLESVNEVLTTTIPDEAAYEAFLTELHANGLWNIYDQWSYGQVKDFYLGIDTTTFDERFHTEPGYVYGASHPIQDWQQVKDRGTIPLDQRIITPYESWPMFRETAKFFFQHPVGEVEMDAGEPIPYAGGATWGDPNRLERKLIGRVVDPDARERLPNRGEIGMAFEYDAGSNGERSNHNYVLEGLLPMLPTSFVLKALSRNDPDLWPLQSKPEEVEEVERRIRVGMTDIVYKGTHGYFSYDYRKLVTDTTAGEWRYYDVEYDRVATEDDKAIAEREFPVIRAYNAPRIGYDYLIGLYKAMFENEPGHAYNADVRLYRGSDAKVPVGHPASLKVGERFAAVVEADEVRQAAGMELTLRYDPAVLKLVAENGESSVRNLMPGLDIVAIDEADEASGTIRFSGVSTGYTTTFSDTKTRLYQVEFELLQEKKDLGIVLEELRFVDAGNRLFAPEFRRTPPAANERGEPH